MISESNKEDCEVDNQEEAIKLVISQSIIENYKKKRQLYVFNDVDDFNFMETELHIEEEKQINQTSILYLQQFKKNESNLPTRIETINKKNKIQCPSMKNNLTNQSLHYLEQTNNMGQQDSSDFKLSLKLQVTQEQNQLLFQEYYQEQHFEKLNKEDLKQSITKLILFSKFQPSNTLQVQNRIQYGDQQIFPIKNQTKRSLSQKHKKESINNNIYLNVSYSKKDQQKFDSKKSFKLKSKEFKLIYY